MVILHPDACATLSDSVRKLHEMGINRIDVGAAYGTVKWSDSDINTMVDAITEIGRYIRKMRSAGGYETKGIEHKWMGIKYPERCVLCEACVL